MVSRYFRIFCSLRPLPAHPTAGTDWATYAADRTRDDQTLAPWTCSVAIDTRDERIVMVIGPMLVARFPDWSRRACL